MEFRTSDASLAPELEASTSYPWIDGYWQAYQVAMILAGRWEQREFHAQPARYFRLAGVTGWQPADAPLIDGAEDLGIRPAAWDHEHCELCNAHIGRNGEATGYVDPDDHWLCTGCYKRYAVNHDLSFVAEA